MEPRIGRLAGLAPFAFLGGAAEWARGVLPVPVCQALEVEPLAAAAVVAYHVLALKVTAETDRTAIIVVGGIKPILALG